MIACAYGYAGRQDLTAELSKAGGFLSSLYTECLTSAITRSIISLRCAARIAAPSSGPGCTRQMRDGPAQVCEVTGRKAHAHRRAALLRRLVRITAGAAISARVTVTAGSSIG